MGSKELLAATGPVTHADFGNIVTREDGWAFLKHHQNKKINIRLDLQDEEGEDFEYAGYDPILHDTTIGEVFGSYRNWLCYMPHLTNILSLIMGDLSKSDGLSDDNIIEELFEFVNEDWDENYNPDDPVEMIGIDQLLKDKGYGGVELDDIVDILFSIARDMYNYLSYVLFNYRNDQMELIWEFLQCTEAYESDGKLYMTVQIYEEALRDLDFMDDRTDTDFVEIANELRKLFVSTERTKHRKENDRIRNRGSTRRLLE